MDALVGQIGWLPESIHTIAQHNLLPNFSKETNLMWLPIKPEDPNQAWTFANKTVSNTHDRMKYGSEPPALRKRRLNIYKGKIAEQIVHRHLREELKLDIREDDNVGGPDQFDFIINHQNRFITSDVKSFHIFQVWKGSTRTPEDVEKKGLALVPVDQYDEGKPKDLYIMAMFLADQRLRTGDCYVRWVTRADISTWRFIPEGTPIYPYDKTQTDNYGQEISECKPMEDFLEYLNLLPPF